MPKPLLSDRRYDFRGGRVTSVSTDLLNANELADATNVTLMRMNSAIVGGFTKRGGTRRVHAAALGAPSVILSAIQWDAPAGKQIVVTATDGKLYYRNAAAGDYGAFTAVTPPTLFNTGLNQAMVPFRGVASGAPLYLYIGDHDVLYRWDGTALTQLTAAGGALDNANLLAAYHTRMFAHQAALLKHAIWSQIGNAENFTSSGLPADGGEAMVDVLNGEAITAYEVIGSSLLIASADSVSRFTGYSNDDIRISTDTEGLSADIGAAGALTLRRFETAAAMLSVKGPYAVTESGIVPIGVKVAPDFRGALTNIRSAIVAYYRPMRTIWFAVSGPADAGLNKTIYAYNVDLQTWYGPFTYPYAITYMTQYQRADGTETILAGCTDGFLRDMDIGVLDDVHSDGTGGSAITMTAEVAPHFFDNGPDTAKSLKRLTLDANPAGSSGVTVETNIDEAGWVTQGALAAASALTRQRVDLDGYGNTIRMRIVDSSTSAPLIYGYTIYAYDMQRHD